MVRRSWCAMQWRMVDCKTWLHKPFLRPLRSVEDANAQFLSKHVIHCAYGEISCPRSSAVQAQNATGEIALSTAVSRWLPLQLFVGPAIVENLVETTHALFRTTLGSCPCKFKEGICNLSSPFVILPTLGLPRSKDLLFCWLWAICDVGYMSSIASASNFWIQIPNIRYFVVFHYYEGL